MRVSSSCGIIDGSMPANNDKNDLRHPDLYLNRELSLLEFNTRVLAQAEDESVPLIERLKFLCISCSNLDEFFEVRVASLKQKVERGAVQTEADGISPQELLKIISERAHDLVYKQYQLLNDELIPKLDDAGIRFVRRTHWTDEQKAWVSNYFDEALMPVLSPLGLDPSHPFPRIQNKSLNFVIALDGKDAFGRRSEYAVVQAPRALPRLVQLPAEETQGGPHDYVFLSSIIHAHVDRLFPGMHIKGCYQFRVTRNSDLFVDEEEVDDLLRALEGELSGRSYGNSVRLEVAHVCSEGAANYLLQKFHLGPDDLYKVDGPVNLNRLLAVPDLVDRPDLKFPSFSPQLDPALGPGGDIFAAIRARDILLHHPYDSFVPVIELVRQAAKDPKVLAIKQTLYRTGSESAVVEALMSAARAGKEVTAVVELRARFDEADNIDLATQLQEVGVHVVYGVVGYKTHAKMTKIVRRENGGFKHYIHLGTGNYHANTARLYTDYGLMTANEEIADDVQALFLQLTSLGKLDKLNKLLNAPFVLNDAMHAKIEREAEHASQGRPASIVAKMNSLTEPSMIEALYKASQAGVKIELVVRGMCCLKPGLPGISENIRVKSVIGRFLEHTRIFQFENAGNRETYLSSADWMERNLFRRVEVCFPVIEPEIRQRLDEELALYLNDANQSWYLQSDGSYQKSKADPEAIGVQSELLSRHSTTG